MALREEDVVVVGAGIAGLATAVALKRVGVQALVLEKADGLRATGAALSLAPNAWVALDALGVSNKLTSLYLPSSKAYITDVATGITKEVPLSKNEGQGLGPRTVHRKVLLEALAEELPNETIRFSSKLTSIEFESEGPSNILIHLSDGTLIKSKVLVGCDGVHSVVARWLGLSRPVNSGRWAVRGLATFLEGHGLRQDHVQKFVDSGRRAGFDPLNDNDLYWVFTSNFPLPDDHGMAGDPKFILNQVLEKYCKDFPAKYSEVVRRSELSTVSWAPLLFRYPWDVLIGKLSNGGVTVAGDAMHPMTPELGQGGCAALEDAVVLGRHIGELFLKNKGLVAQEVNSAIKGYVNERRWRAASLVTGSYLSGWAQLAGSGGWRKFLRDSIFYRFIYPKFFDSIHYDCGKLPLVPSAQIKD
ncbi:FAD-binding domain [Dillenia turbinata]|uniref:FAD-binding domain n=1 Tax=Dillenia turbinata TaxID=194707 RepID=A0AAN8V3W9_9MAGN